MMKPLPHQYDVHLTGGPAGYAQLSTAGVPELRTAPPEDYDGPGDAWSPEHLLLASVRHAFCSPCGQSHVYRGWNSRLSSWTRREP